MTGLRFVASATVFLTVGSVYVSAADREFNSLVSEVSKRYEIHAIHIPFMGLVSMCARMASHGGVKGLHVAEFDNLRTSVDVSDLTSLVRTSLGADWQPFVTERSKDGQDQSVIFVRPRGSAMRMLIAEYEHNELDVLAMELNGEVLAKWMNKSSQAR